MSLQDRLLTWATDSLSGLLNALVPADEVAACKICERPTPRGVQPCTECYYGAALMRPVQLTDMDRRRIMARAAESLIGPMSATPVPEPVDHVDQIGDLIAEFIASSANTAAQSCPAAEGHDGGEVDGEPPEPSASPSPQK